MEEEKTATASAGSGHSYERENTLVAHVLNNMTSSMRFPGILNVDMNEITMNLVPFPRMHFLASSVAPLYSVLDVAYRGAGARGIIESFTETLAKENQLVSAYGSNSLYLACGLIARGKHTDISDAKGALEKISRGIRMVNWNTEGFKLGICEKPPPNGQDYSILALSNTTGIARTFEGMLAKF